MLVLALLATLAACGVLYQWQGARRHPPVPGVLVEVGGHRLHSVCRGQGQPVVVLESAIAASSLSWALVQPEVARVTRVCAYDRAGLGWSDPPSTRRSFSRIVDDLSALLASAAAGDRQVLVGHSFGTFIVLAYAARRPGDVAGLVLVDPPVEWLTMTPERRRALRGAMLLSRVGGVLARLGIVRASLALLAGGAPGAPRRFVRIFGPTAARTLERLVGEVRKLPPEIHPLVQAVWCQPKCFAAMAAHFSVFAREASLMTALSPPPHVPVVVISSGGHPPDHLAAHRALAARAAGGRHLVAKRGGHWVQFDEPDLVVRAICDIVTLARTGVAGHGPA